MFHGETLKNLKNLRIHEVFFYIYIFLIPIQTRILYFPEQAYVSWYFSYHLAFFVYLTDFILVACFITWFLYEGHKLRITNHRLFWLMLAFFISILASLFHVKHISLGVYETLKWLELIILFLYIRFTCNTTEKFYKVVWVIFISGIIQALIAIGQFHVQHSLGLSWLGEYVAPIGTAGLSTINTATGKVIRAYGTMPHPNILAGFLTICLILALFLQSQIHSRITDHGSLSRRILVACGTLIITIGLFLTFSRIAWIAGGLAILCFTMFHRIKKHWRGTFLSSLALIVSFISILIFYTPYLAARIVDSNQTSFNDRTFFNNLGLKLISDNPLLGVGPGNYIPILDKTQLEPWQNQPPHNIFIFIAAELGILGLAVFFWILFEILRGLNAIKYDHLLFTSYYLLVTLVFLGQFDHYFVTIQQGRLIFFTILGLIAAASNLNETSDSQT